MYQPTTTLSALVHHSTSPEPSLFSPHPFTCIYFYSGRNLVTTTMKSFVFVYLLRLYVVRVCVVFRFLSPPPTTNRLTRPPTHLSPLHLPPISPCISDPPPLLSLSLQEYAQPCANRHFRPGVSFHDLSSLPPSLLEIP